jgi:hypothetical protein
LTCEIITTNQIENMKKMNYAVITTATLCALPLVAQAGGGPPPVPEPSTVIAGAACLVPLAVGVVRAMRKPRK